MPPARTGGAEGSGRPSSPERGPAAEPRGRGDAPDDIASQAIDELQEDAQSGDVLAYGGFVPAQLAQHYVRQVLGRGPGERTQARVEELAEKLVDRILVSPPSGTHSAQMQIRLVGEVLDGSEIWMRRERGELRLDFRGGSERSRAFLAEHGEGLARELSERLNEPVRVAAAAAASGG